MMKSFPVDLMLAPVLKWHERLVSIRCREYSLGRRRLKEKAHETESAVTVVPESLLVIRKDLV